MHVSAKDKGTGKEQKITITASSGLSKDEVERMVRESEAHAEEDRRRREVVDARNQADALAYQVERTLTDNRARLSQATVERIERAVAAVREASKGEDLASIRSASDELQRASHAMAEELYRQPGAQAGAQQGGAGDGGVKEGEVVEGEYTEH